MDQVEEIRRLLSDQDAFVDAVRRSASSAVVTAHSLCFFFCVKNSGLSQSQAEEVLQSFRTSFADVASSLRCGARYICSVVQRALAKSRLLDSLLIPAPLFSNGEEWVMLDPVRAAVDILVSTEGQASFEAGFAETADVPMVFPESIPGYRAPQDFDFEVASEVEALTHIASHRISEGFTFCGPRFCAWSAVNAMASSVDTGCEGWRTIVQAYGGPRPGRVIVRRCASSALAFRMLARKAIDVGGADALPLPLALYSDITPSRRYRNLALHPLFVSLFPLRGKFGRSDESKRLVGFLGSGTSAHANRVMEHIFRVVQSYHGRGILLRFNGTIRKFVPLVALVKMDLDELRLLTMARGEIHPRCCSPSDSCLCAPAQRAPTETAGCLFSDAARSVTPYQCIGSGFASDRLHENMLGIERHIVGMLRDYWRRGSRRDAVAEELGAVGFAFGSDGRGESADLEEVGSLESLTGILEGVVWRRWIIWLPLLLTPRTVEDVPFRQGLHLFVAAYHEFIGRTELPLAFSNSNVQDVSRLALYIRERFADVVKEFNRLTDSDKRTVGKKVHGLSHIPWDIVLFSGVSAGDNAEWESLHSRVVKRALWRVRNHREGVSARVLARATLSIAAARGVRILATSRAGEDRSAAATTRGGREPKKDEFRLFLPSHGPFTPWIGRIVEVVDESVTVQWFVTSTSRPARGLWVPIDVERDGRAPVTSSCPSSSAGPKIVVASTSKGCYALFTVPSN